MNINKVAPLYILQLTMMALALSQLGTSIIPKKQVVERCAITVYHGGNRVIYIGKGEVWR